MKRKITLIAALTLCFAAFAQVPNGSFETWKNFTFMGTTVNYPDKWFSNNLMVLAGADASAEKVQGMNGGNAISVKTITFDDGDGPQTYSGLLTSADFTDLMDVDFDTRFAISNKPTMLEGYYKYEPVGGDTFTLGVLIYSQGQVIGEGFLTGDDAVTAFTKFSIPIDYHSNDVLDSATVTMLSSANNEPHEGTALIVDEIVLKNANSTSILKNTAFNGRVFPIPTKDKVYFELPHPYTGTAIVEVRDINGRLVKTLEIQMDGNRLEAEVGDCPAGILFAYVNAGEQSGSYKIVKN